MSLNKKNMKILRGEEIRIMRLVPNTWTELQEALKDMYGTSEFQLTYVDEEGDPITVANELDLNEAYIYFENKPSIRMNIKLKTISDNFEELKIQEPTKKNPEYMDIEEGWGGKWRGKWRGRDIGRRGHCMGMGNRGRWMGMGNRGRWMGMGMNFPFCGKDLEKMMMKFFKKNCKNHGKTLRLKVIQKNFPKQWIVSSGSNVVISWTVLNKGLYSWPEGTTIETIGGNIELTEPVVFGEVKPGETVSITANARVPNEQGKCSGTWGVIVSGECAGMLKAKFYSSAETVDAKVQTLVSMGFTSQQSLEALQKADGNLDLAISSMVYH